MTTEAERLERLNEFIRVIGDNGRRFFKSAGEYRYARMELDDRGRVWFIDDYTQERIFTHYPGRWRHFSHGGTLKTLVVFFRNHIKRGTRLPAQYFDLSRFTDRNHIWGYPEEDLKRVEAEGIRLGIVIKE